MPSATDAPPFADDDIVVSGMAGRLPESDNMEEFAEQLFAGVDLVTADDRRWKPGLHGLPERNGKLKHLERFDAQHFGVSGKQAHLMDPQLRLLLEITHEALLDAGQAPAELRGTRTGVFVGVSNSETEERWTAEPDKINGYALTGCCRAMFPNRVSFAFDFKGPSYAVDTACSSSMFALAQAAAAMRAGHCDAAVVAGTNLCLKPANSLNFHRLSMLSPEGRCAAFDAAGRGYVRSEAAVAVLLQRRSSARRVYATLRGARTNTDGAKEQGITYPSGAVQQSLARETFQEARLRPRDVAYVEAHGTGTKVGDPQEVNAIADLFCDGRSTPLLLGSVKSNMGHSEPASGLCSIAKVLLAIQRGQLPANLHYKSPNMDIPALSDGRIKVVDRNTPWDGGLVAINSFGFGGANAHIIMQSEPRKPARQPAATKLPRLVLASGRTEEAVATLLAAGRKSNQGLRDLLSAVAAQPAPTHAWRGFTLADATPSDAVEQIEENGGGERRPVWFVFSGMGSQWAGMGRPLLELPPCAKALDACAAALKPHGLELLPLLTDAPASAFDDVTSCFVAIAAVQVALVDLMTAVGVKPDGIVGHSVGEIGCAYADGTLTREQAVLAAWWRGRSIAEAALAPGAMAAVGLSWEEAGKRCGATVQPACHNSADSVTVSGPVADVERLVAELSAEGIFARRVASAGVAFHSRYIAAAAPKLLASLQRIIPSPKPRSPRWVSSSVPEDKWDTPLARSSSAEYHVNNLTSPVRFASALAHVPERALVLELAPHALLQAVLKRARPQCAHVGLVRKERAERLQLLLALGRLFCGGAQPQLASLYGPPQWPVPVDTPGLGALVRWDHSQEWSVADFHDASAGREMVLEVDLSRAEDAYMAGHRIDGRVLLPATGYLALVWRALCQLHGREPRDAPVLLEDVHFLRATILQPDRPARLLLHLLPAEGRFELSEAGAAVVTGKARLLPPGERPQRLALPKAATASDDMPLAMEDVYKELRLRGYEYEGIFRGITKADARGNRGMLAWNDNWVAFLDTMLQFGIVGTDARLLYLPTRLQRLALDPALHEAALLDSKGGPLPVLVDRALGVTQAGGVELRGLKTSLAPRRANPQSPKLETFDFVPYDNATPTCDDPERSLRDALTVCVQLALENTGALRLKLGEAADGRAPERLLMPTVLDVLDGEPMVRADASLAAGGERARYKELADAGVNVSDKAEPEGARHVVLGAAVAERPAALARLEALLGDGGLLLLLESRGAWERAEAAEAARSCGLVRMARQAAAGGELHVLRKPLPSPQERLWLRVTHDDYGWVEPLKAAMARAETTPMRIVLAGSGYSGVLGLATCLRAEPGGAAVRALLADEELREDDDKVRAMLALDAAVGVLAGGRWGTYRHIALADADARLSVRHAYVNTLTRGDLASLRWLEAPPALAADDRLCSVYCAPLNFRDIMLATGKLPPDALPGALAQEECILGLEWAGREAGGERVMGMVAARGLASSVQPAGFVWRVPAAWALAEAATVPVAYGTAYYALVVRGGLRRGMSLLVHAGAGGVGQAAIRIGLSRGCRVFATVGTPDKRAFLLKTFPELRDECIGNSRDTSFEQLVMAATDGKGVDLVLNSLAGEQLQASLRCVAVGGRFLEIGKLDLSQNTPLGMAVFLRNIAFHGILLDALFEADDKNPERQAVQKLMDEGLRSGEVRPLPATVFARDQLEEAFRFMATGKHIGKVVIRVREEEKERGKAPPAWDRVPAVPRLYLHPHKSYVLVGGMGGFGLELGGWLVTRGARCLVLTSRSGIRNGYQAACIRRWRASGVSVTVWTAESTSEAGAAALLKAAAKEAPVGGIFNLAAVLKDAFLDKQTPDSFREVAEPKVDGTLALDAASRLHCPALDHFVTWSSVSCGRGNAGQTNYGLANAAMERVCRRRVAAGLPALAVQWGAVGDVGMLAAASSSDSVGGTVPQRIASCLDSLALLMARPHAVAACLVLADKRRAAPAAAAGLVSAVANILGIKDAARVADGASLAELGMDSLMGAEIKQTLERSYDLALGVQEIRALTFGKLREMSGGGGGGETAAPAATAAAAAAPAAGRSEALRAALQTLMPAEALIKLPSAAEGAGMPVFMVHPIEGGATALAGLAQRVQGAVRALQCTADAPLDALPALAAHYVKLVRAHWPKPPYTLLGYSFGATVAFEMALQLERAGLETRLVLVDGSPMYVAAHTQRGVGGRTRAAGAAPSGADEADALAHFLALLVGLDAQKAAAELEALPSWDARLKRAGELAGADGADAALVRAAAESFYRKLVVADNYRAGGKVRGPVALFTARDNYVPLEADYGLRALCAGSLSTRQLAADHRTILAGEPAQLIAQHVSQLLR